MSSLHCTARRFSLHNWLDIFLPLLQLLLPPCLGMVSALDNFALCQEVINGLLVEIAFLLMNDSFDIGDRVVFELFLKLLLVLL